MFIQPLPQKKTKTYIIDQFLCLELELWEDDYWWHCVNAGWDNLGHPGNQVATISVFGRNKAWSRCTLVSQHHMNKIPVPRIFLISQDSNSPPKNKISVTKNNFPSEEYHSNHRYKTPKTRIKFLLQEWLYFHINKSKSQEKISCQKNEILVTARKYKKQK